MIKDLDFIQRSLLFARLAEISYLDQKKVTKEAKKLGFDQVEYYDVDGAQSYRFQNKTDCVISCRGTQPTQWNDIKADLRAWPVISETVSRVHKGFKKEVDDLWPLVKEDIQALDNSTTLWFCGHSLGAAMATIMASRCLFDKSLADPEELYTYGSPRVGWPKYASSLGVVHHRWVNNNDIVTRVPFQIMGYRHHGTEHYLNAYGKLRNPTGWQRIKDRFRGMRDGLKKGKIDNFADHSITEYANYIEKISKEK